jgi:UDP-2,3-diacylglucosamine pyrophosphatase LpxH
MSTKLKLQIASDLHIEYDNDEFVDPLTLITPSADVLILAGDIGSFYKYDQLYNFISVIAPHFSHVLYIPGNHEFYVPPKYSPKSYNELISIMDRLNDSVKNLTVLNRRSVQIGDLCIAGATLWSDIKCELPKFIVRIHGMDTRTYRNNHILDSNYIKDMVGYCKDHNLRLLCVTHHPPTYDVLKVSTSKKRDKFVSLYASSMDDLLVSDNMFGWVCGHVHSNFDFVTDGGCRVMGNQMGKPKDNIMDYSNTFVIEC